MFWYCLIFPGGNLKFMSEQQLLDCVYPGENGCEGRSATQLSISFTTFSVEVTHSLISLLPLTTQSLYFSPLLLPIYRTLSIQEDGPLMPGLWSKTDSLTSCQLGIAMLTRPRLSSVGRIGKEMLWLLLILIMMKIICRTINTLLCDTKGYRCVSGDKI